MQLLDRYIATRVFQGYILVALVLVSLLALLDLAEQLEDVGKGDYQIVDALVVTALHLPRRCLEMFPMIALLGACIGLGGMAAARELVILQATGISPWRMGWSILKTALLLVILAMAVEELLATPLQQLAQRRQALARLGDESSEQRLLSQEFLSVLSLRNVLRERLEQQLDLSGEGFWSREGGRFLRVGDFQDGEPSDVTVYEFDSDYQLQQFIHAQRVSMDDRHWVFLQPTWKNREDGVLVTRTPPTLLWDSFIDATQIRIARALRYLRLSPNNLSPLDLISHIEYLEANNQDSLRYRLGLWQKLALPVNITAMVLLAIPFVLGPLRNAHSGQRLMLGALIGVLFFFGNQITQNTGLILRWWPPLTALLPGAVLLLASIGLIGFRRWSTS